MVAVATLHFIGKGKANTVPSPEALSKRGRNLFHAGGLGLIPGGKDEPVLHHPSLHLNEISWKRSTFRGFSMRVRRFGNILKEDMESRFISANGAALRIVGIKPEEVPGFLGKSLVPDTPDAQRRVQEAFASVGRAQTPVAPCWSFAAETTANPSGCSGGRSRNLAANTHLATLLAAAGSDAHGPVSEGPAVPAGSSVASA
jgi:hypothetical protein